MAETDLTFSSMEIEDQCSIRSHSVSSSSTDNFSIFSDDPVEERINKWLDTIGLKMIDPNDRLENYFEMNRTRIFHSISTSDEADDEEETDNDEFSALPINKCIKKPRKLSLGGLNLSNSGKISGARKLSGEISLGSNDLLSRRKKQLKKFQI